MEISEFSASCAKWFCTECGIAIERNKRADRGVFARTGADGRLIRNVSARKGRRNRKMKTTELKGAYQR